MPRKSPSPRNKVQKLPKSAQKGSTHGGNSAWSGRFAEPVAERVKRYTASVDFDRRLAQVDIRGSLAHARMLATTGIITRGDLAAILRGMKAIQHRQLPLVAG